MISGIRIHGKCFSLATDLDIFPNLQNRISIVYGRNGSGKSTISKAFAEIARNSGAPGANAQTNATGNAQNGQSAHFIESSLLFERSSPTLMQDDVTNSIAVFNETFVDKNLKIESDGIAAVLLFGDDIALREAIGKKRREWHSAKESKEKMELQKSAACERESIALKAAERKLKQGWADRSRRILRSSNATTSWKATLAEVEVAKKAEGSLADAVTSLERKIARYESVAVSEKIIPGWQERPNSELIAAVDNGLLLETIEMPSGEGLRQKIASSLSRHEEIVRRAREVFNDPHVDHCPLCQQDVDDGYQERIVEEIARALGEEDVRFTNRLDGAKISALPPASYSADSRIGESLTIELAGAVEKFNKHIEAWNAQLELKKSHMYAPIVWDDSPLRQGFKELLDVLARVESRCDEWNADYDQQVDVQRQLMRDNSSVARLEHDVEFRELNQSRAAVSEASRLLGELDAAEKKAHGELQALQLQASNPQGAAEVINAFVRDVFADAGRLKLELLVHDDDRAVTEYRVIGRGSRLKPEDLSVGERNILALSYFFAKVRQKVENASSNEPFLVVLDDPISSVDVDNRLGIHGLLESRMQEILASSNRSRMLMMTHDLTAARDLQKSAKSAIHSSLDKSKHRRSIAEHVLEPGEKGSYLRELKDVKLEALNEYQELMTIMYGFASLETRENLDSWQRATIGNVSRRVFEAFSTFIYKTGILGDPLIDEYKSKYPERELTVDLRAGHRGFLHDSSHSGDGLTSLRNFGGFAGLSDGEKVLHVRRLLGLMFALQEAHVRQYLPEDACAAVEGWKEGLIGRL